ncbi:helicase HerA-like domain-containing protein [Streptomyces sp. NPDC049597]|uniref:helicase HerA-like domain-containing protein n=1 Tax=Streptomyces sp. NPDC049597 TaxID=3155276 RepID=UPI0034169AF5
MGQSAPSRPSHGPSRGPPGRPPPPDLHGPRSASPPMLGTGSACPGRRSLEGLPEPITRTVRLIRPKGVGIFFVTQPPNDALSQRRAAGGDPAARRCVPAWSCYSVTSWSWPSCRPPPLPASPSVGTVTTGLRSELRSWA